METLDILVGRQRDNYTASDNDGNIVYVAPDGGAMKSIVSLGALHQLGEEGLLQHVDGFGNGSGGSFNAAYAMVGKTLVGRDIYTNYLAEQNFMSLGRQVRLGVGDLSLSLTLPIPYVNMSVLRDVIQKEAPLPLERIVNDTRELIVGVSDLKLARAVSVSSHELHGKHERLASALIAGASLPLGLTGKYEQDDLGTFADAGLFWPTSDAIARQRSGVTHVLSLASSPRPRRVGGAVQWLADTVQAHWCSRYSDRGARMTWEMARRRDKIMGNFAIADRVVLDNTVVERIYPEPGGLPSRYTRDKRTLAYGFEAGRQAVIKALKGSQTSV